MIIRHVACIAPPRLGGIGKAALSWVEALARRGHTAELVVPEHPDRQGVSALVRAWPVRYAWGNAAVLRDVHTLTQNVDVLHVHYPFYGTVEPLLWKQLSCPVVLHFHMDAVANDWRGWIFDAHRRFLQPRLLKNSDRVIVSSLDYAKHSSLASFLLAYPQKVVELPFFVNTERYQPAERTPRSRPRLLFVGALDRAHDFKGLSLLLEVLHDVPNVDLYVVGDGDTRASYEASVLRLGLSERVHFCGRQDEEELIRSYQQADLLVFPSVSRAEAFGLVSLEAQACGTPVLASNLSGVRTLIEEGKTGWLMEPNSTKALREKLLALLAHPEQLLEAGTHARLRVLERYTETRVIDELEKMYQNVCASR